MSVERFAEKVVGPEMPAWTFRSLGPEGPGEPWKEKCMGAETPLWEWYIGDGTKDRMERLKAG